MSRRTFDDLSRRANSASYAAGKWIHGRLWQSGYFERVLRDEEDAHDVARYILQNPLRAGLVATPQDYPFLGSALVSTEQLMESTMWRPK